MTDPNSALSRARLRVHRVRLVLGAHVRKERIARDPTKLTLRANAAALALASVMLVELARRRPSVRDTAAINALSEIERRSRETLGRD